MLSSTFTALRMQGLPTQELRRAASTSFSLERCDLDARGTNCGFWLELVAARRAYRDKTGYNIEEIIACSG